MTRLDLELKFSYNVGSDLAEERETLNAHANNDLNISRQFYELVKKLTILPLEDPRRSKVERSLEKVQALFRGN